jgi:competence protein ComEA
VKKSVAALRGWAAWCRKKGESISRSSFLSTRPPGAVDFEKVKVGLYRAQQRLAITRSEATALLALALLLGAGMAIRYVQQHQPPAAAQEPPFAATDHRFQEGAARLRAAQKDAAPPEAEERRDAPRALTAGDTASINLNAAPPTELGRLPGVGPVLAGRIAAYREQHGSFAEVDHLRRVSGIGPKTMNDLSSLLVAEAPADTGHAAGR